MCGKGGIVFWGKKVNVCEKSNIAFVVSGLSPNSPKPDSPNLEKVHSISKCSCFVETIVLRIFNYIFSPNFLVL